MTLREGTVRIGLLPGGDAHLAEQVGRVAKATGAVVVGEEPVDLWLVEELREGGAALGRAHRRAGTPVLGVRFGRRSRPPVLRCVPDGGQVVELPADEEPFLRYLGSLSLAARAQVVGVVGARGGAGASTIAAALAREAVRAGTCTALVDLDASGGGLDLLLGVEHEPGPRWADLRAERTGFPAAALSLALPRWNAVRILSGDARGGARPGDPGAPDAVRALASEHDLVVLDLPRNDPWAQGAATPTRRPGSGVAETSLPPCQLVLVVATCDVRSALAARALRQRMRSADLRLVVRSPGPGGLDPGEFAQACGLPLGATMRTERGSAAAAERGEAPGDNRRGAIARAAARLAVALELVP